MNGSRRSSSSTSASFLDGLRVAPDRFSDRLLSLFELDGPDVVAAVERLAAGTAELVRERFPDLEVDGAGHGPNYAPGKRETAWTA